MSARKCPVCGQNGLDTKCGQGAFSYFCHSCRAAADSAATSFMLLGGTREEADAYIAKQMLPPTRQDRIDEAAMEIVHAQMPLVRSTARLAVEAVNKAKRK